MKKTLFLLLALCGLTLPAMVSATENSGTSTSANFGDGGSFTITYEWDSAPMSANIKVGYGDTVSGTVSLSAGVGWMYPTLNGSLDTALIVYQGLQGGVPYSFSVNNYNNDNATFVFSYQEGASTTTIYNEPVRANKDRSRPQSITNLTIHQSGATVTLGSDRNVLLNTLMIKDYEKGTIVTPKDLTLLALHKLGNTMQPNKVDNLVVNGKLTLGSAESVSALTATGTLSVAGGITLGNIGSTITAAELLGNSLNVTVADSELQKLNGSTTVLTLGKAFDGTTTLNGAEGEYLCGEKMIYSLVWETPLARGNAAAELTLNATPNSAYVENKLAQTVSSHNGRAGLVLVSNAFVAANPQTNAPAGALAGLMDAVDAGTMTDKDLAASAGASAVVLGQALSGDTERQLRAIRNRVAMGYYSRDAVALDGKGGSASKPENKKYLAWVNAEGNRSEQNNDGTDAGYTLSSWGGTVGAGMQVNNQLTLGLALTAMYGDLQSDGPDYLKGDMDTAYLSAFAQYKKGAWSHAFIGTAGTMQADYRRTVSHAAGSYSTDGDTDGTAFGLMYELSREYTLSAKSSISPVFNISYRHTDVDAYSESGADAALNVGEQGLDTVTVGLGARYAAVVGQQTLNRACAFEARALAKYDFGDTQTDTNVGFINQSARANIESAELGAFGVELGAGISVPVGRGSIFADGSVELRSDYTNFNATVGYRVEF